MEIDPQSAELELGLILAIIGTIFSLGLKYKKTSVPHVRMWKIFMAGLVVAGIALIWVSVQ